MTFIDAIDYIGTYAFALSGIKLAASKKFDLLGAFIAGGITAIGGGTLRDLILDLPPFWIIDYSYLLITLIAMLSYIFLGRFFHCITNTLPIFDAIGLAFFTVVGIQKSLDTNIAIWAAIIMGMFTGAAGGVLRDILLNDQPMIFKDDIYATACIVGGIAFAILYSLNIQSFIVQLISAITVFVIRVLALKYKGRLPVMRKL